MTREYSAFLGAFCAGLGLLTASSALAADSPPHVDTSGANMQPTYPASALPSRESGAVVIGATVRSDGTVKGVTLRKSSGYSDLDTAAANAVNGWKFVPATRDGSPVEGTANVQIVFTPPN